MKPGGSIEYHYGGEYVLSRDDWERTYKLRQYTPREPIENTGVYYNAPSRAWSYDTSFNTTPPPGTPQGVIMSKGRWYQQ